jgi:hypothetical protein
MTSGRQLSRTVNRTIPLWAAILLGLGTTGPLAAQTIGEAKDRLVVDDVQLGWCVDFLIEPILGSKLLPKGWVGTPASEVPGLPEGLTGTFEENGDWKGWFPGRVCSISARSASVRDQAIEYDKPRKPPTVVWLQIAARGGEAPVAYVLPILSTNTYRIRSPLATRGIKLGDVSFETGPNPDKDDPQDGFQAKLEGATLFWKGYLKPDTMPASPADTLDALYQNGIDKPWRVQVTRVGGTPNRVAGVVGVLGKGPLFAALKISPIRLVSRVQTGGASGMAFFELH